MQHGVTISPVKHVLPLKPIDSGKGVSGLSSSGMHDEKIPKAFFFLFEKKRGTFYSPPGK